MFGLGKKSKSDASAPSDAFVAKPPKSSGSKLDLKGLLLQHGEKAIVGLIGIAAAYFLWTGMQTTSIDETKTTDDLVRRASSTKELVLSPHWDQIAPTRQQEINFKEKSARSRQPTKAIPYRNDFWENAQRNKSGKRGDPVLLAPINLKADAFMGAIAVNSNRPAAIDNLPLAGEINKRRTRRGEETPATPVERHVADGYDFGYKVTAVTTAKDPLGRRGAETQQIVPKFATFAAITAAVPHEAMVNSYLDKLEGASNFNRDRDSPNYLGYEVQRIDITDIADLGAIKEGDWQTLPNVNLKAYQKMIDTWPGTADETAKSGYVADPLTMKIPPILMTNYQRLVDHPKIPQIAKKANASAYGSAGYGEGYGSEPVVDYGSNYGTPDYGAGYGGNDTTDVYSTATAKPAVDPALLPKALELTDYKLLRFFDFEVKPGHKYIYRTRLILEDPNYPRAESLQPATSTMATETVARVQALQMEDAKKTPPAKDQPIERSSKLFTDWSSASEPVLIPSPSRLFAGSVSKQTQPFRIKDKSIDLEMKTGANLVYAEWNPTLATAVPEVLDTTRGSVLGGSPEIDGGLDVIDPVSKKLKEVSNYSFGNVVTVADVIGGTKMPGSTRDNELLEQAVVVGFDNQTGQLVVSREFEDFASYRMYSFADEKDKLKEKEKEAK